MPVGRVKWFNDAKGYGFIEQTDGGDDVFVHYSSIDMDGYKTLSEGMEVDYEFTQGDKGLHATTLERAPSHGRGAFFFEISPWRSARCRTQHPATDPTSTCSTVMH
jgi:CspA family cold shock protein